MVIKGNSCFCLLVHEMLVICLLGVILVKLFAYNVRSLPERAYVLVQVGHERHETLILPVLVVVERLARVAQVLAKIVKFLK